MKINCTICSRGKMENSELLPAVERYTGAHIKTVKEIADGSKVPLYLFSGKYGLISGNEKIPHYDYYLEESKIEALAKKVRNQIQKEKITEIELYLEDKASWHPYRRVMEKATGQAGVILHIHKLAQ